ncbi:ABC transporter ATP-binding protein [Halomonas sp. McH1-25]|uniref:ABC transporter ATP-binding protein n=1 Tax=unclassified Halomonas TaxID=2609666 RepID=UPI001EF3DDC7|nr:MULTISPECIES: ABC transporter ATP-binding protein [unclassified Halomonas]MCG7598324.1 ABC transporter ATP-binding protein [Halomonas sp. McH1-25]MCP1340893.1 ABC transporter ATP-binding protein [Halomonas sp. FL8]MCP1361616.1 ABC transporter ATP-binding protein [Halomonas sp. BBD45]MCP1366390.1 ABC transporter ATP-binding protein [Halomonas sp. BBD48]
MSALEIRQVRKDFGATRVLKDVSLSIDSGEFLILVGPSGCGKSTLMNAIAGLEPVTAGEILIAGEDVTWRTPAERDIAMVFQSYALYPSMTVRQNIAFGLEMRKVPKAEREAAVERVADLLQISPLLDRKPSQLSGGQRQRVAMGRALAREPKIYLFDEPLSNLDAKLRVEMRTEIKKLHQRLGTTIVYVTHDQIEAMTLADRIAVMRDGHILQLGTPEEVYNDPVDMFVAGFMGSPSMNFIQATLEGDAGAYRLAIETPESPRLVLPWPAARETPAMADAVGGRAVLGLRPEHFSEEDLRLGDRAEGTLLAAKVTVAEPTGADILLRLPLGDGEVTARVGPKASIAAGEWIELRVDMSRAVLFSPDSERRLA